MLESRSFSIPLSLLTLEFLSSWLSAQVLEKTIPMRSLPDIRQLFINSFLLQFSCSSISEIRNELHQSYSSISICSPPHHAMQPPPLHPGTRHLRTSHIRITSSASPPQKSSSRTARHCIENPLRDSASCSQSSLLHGPLFRISEVQLFTKIPRRKQQRDQRSLAIVRCDELSEFG